MFIGRGKDCGMAFLILGCRSKLHNQNKVGKIQQDWIRGLCHPNN
jgi:hypothetical protein